MAEYFRLLGFPGSCCVGVFQKMSLFWEYNEDPTIWVHARAPIFTETFTWNSSHYMDPKLWDPSDKDPKMGPLILWKLPFGTLRGWWKASGPSSRHKTSGLRSPGPRS